MYKINKKIIIKLIGGMGNQLFQYYFGWKCAKFYGCQVQYDASWFKDRKKPHERVRLNDLGLDWEVQPDKGLLFKWAYTNRYGKRMPLPRNIRYINEKNAISLDNIRIKNGAYFDGFWQKEHIYSDMRSVITNDICAKLDKKYDSAAVEIEGENCASIHVRRGDYISSKDHFAQPREYYIKSIEILIKSKNIKTFYVFSDEPSWFFDNIYVEGCVFINVSDVELGSDIAEFNIMRKLKNHIISSSTFSWWAAWIGSYKTNGIVCYPSSLPKDLVPARSEETWVCV